MKLLKSRYMSLFLITLMLLSFLQIQTAEKAVAVSSLISEWNMEGATNNTVTDNYGTAGDIMGNSSFGNGVIGQAFKFTGSNYISIPNPSRFNYMTNFTLAAWVYPTSQSGSQYIISKTTSNRDFVFDIINGTLNFHIAHGSSYFHVNGGAVPLNTWTHVAAVYSNGTVTLYQNVGVVGIASLGTFAPPDWTGTRMNIGGLSNSAGFQGKIDDVKIFNTALSAYEISSMVYNPLPMDIWSFEHSTLSTGYYYRNLQSVNSSYPYNSSGITGAAASLSGNDGNYFNIPSCNVYNYDMSYFTISAWIKPSSIYVTKKPILSKTSPNLDYALYIADGRLVFEIAKENDTSSTFYAYGGTIPTGTWTHVAAVFSNGSIMIYQNGVVAGAASMGPYTPTSWTGTKMQIGALNDVTGFSGLIDELKIFRGALSLYQVRAEYVNGTTGHTP